MQDLAIFALQEQPEGNLMVAISRAWYNGSYTMTAKPIKSMELRNTMIKLFKTLHIKSFIINDDNTKEMNFSQYQ